MAHPYIQPIGLLPWVFILFLCVRCLASREVYLLSNVWKDFSDEEEKKKQTLLLYLYSIIYPEFRWIVQVRWHIITNRIPIISTQYNPQCELFTLLLFCKTLKESIIFTILLFEVLDTFYLFNFFFFLGNRYLPISFWF